MADSIYPPDPEGGVEAYFPLNREAPEPHTFEIALVLGGTVSAGCYTAGVLDFLIEALDAWAAQKTTDDPAVPRHKVLLRVVTGTSGGGVNAVLLARALNYYFPPANIETDEKVRAKNPFYEIWVNDIDITGLLAPSDISATTTAIPSLLSGQPLKDSAAKGVSFVGEPAPRRDYVINPLPVFLTFTNVAGIPYQQHFSNRSCRAEYFVNHADFVRFAVDMPCGLYSQAYPVSPDMLSVGDTEKDDVGWCAMRQYALGTGAFPVGLPAITVARPAMHYAYRYVIPNDGDGLVKARWLRPDWSCFLGTEPGQGAHYSFVSVDGGCTDNEPIGLAQEWLTGIDPKRETKGIAVKRAIILIDPFSDKANIPTGLNTSLFGMLPYVLNTFIESTRFASADISAFFNEEDFSRYLITPSGENSAGLKLTGGAALASSGLSAFIGFLSRGYREHDYMLGRRNCQKFLQSWFVLPAKNNLFMPTEPASDGEDIRLPIIPLYGTASVPQAAPRQPAPFKAASIQNLVAGRIAALLYLAISKHFSSRWVLWLVRKACFVIGRLAARGPVTYIQAQINKSKILNP